MKIKSNYTDGGTGPVDIDLLALPSFRNAALATIARRNQCKTGCPETNNPWIDNRCNAITPSDYLSNAQRHMRLQCALQEEILLFTIDQSNLRRPQF